MNKSTAKFNKLKKNHESVFIDFENGFVDLKVIQKISNCIDKPYLLDSYTTIVY